MVVKHEALAVRRGRAGVAGEEVDLDAVPAVGVRSVEERRESAERVERSAEVMRRLKRDEARALMLKAEGLSYVEIGERLGWTYTKVLRPKVARQGAFEHARSYSESGHEFGAGGNDRVSSRASASGAQVRRAAARRKRKSCRSNLGHAAVPCWRRRWVETL